MLETLVKAEERADEGRGLIIVVGRGLHTPLGQPADLKVYLYLRYSAQRSVDDSYG